MTGLVMVDSGRTTLAKRIYSSTICLAVGSGLSAWASPPADPAVTDSALAAPVAMVRSSAKSFVVPDSASGTILMPDSSKWSISANPSKYLYVSFVLGFSDGAADVYKELGLYLDPTFTAGVPAGQNYVPWANVTAPGDLLALEHFLPIERTGVRATFSKILTF